MKTARASIAEDGTLANTKLSGKGEGSAHPSAEKRERRYQEFLPSRNVKRLILAACACGEICAEAETDRSNHPLRTKTANFELN
jgi:hypothetical protein